MKIVLAPQSVLTTPAKPVGRVDKRIIKIVTDMQMVLDRQRDPDGVGLAAPQVDVPLRIFIMHADKRKRPVVCINPVLVTGKKTTKQKTDPKKRVSTKKARETKLEGCLSIVGVWGKVERSPEITITYMDLVGQEHTVTFTGFEATVVQHEMDHLDGILFTTHVLSQGNTLYHEKDGELKKYDEI